MSYLNAQIHRKYQKLYDKLELCGDDDKALKGAAAALDTALTAKIDVNRPIVCWGDQYLLNAAARSGHVTLVQRLLDSGANHGNAETWFGYTALHDAAACGHSTVVKLLLKQGRRLFLLVFIYVLTESRIVGADPNARTPYGFSPLDVAANHGRDAVVALLEPLTSAPPVGIEARKLRALNNPATIAATPPSKRAKKKEVIVDV